MLIKHVTRMQAPITAASKIILNNWKLSGTTVISAALTFGDFQNFYPHLHILATDGCFYNDAAFMVCPPPDTGELEKLLRYEVFKMLKAEGKITDVVIENMLNWHHSGFNVYCGKTIWPHNQEGLENLARYIIRASFSQERMTYVAAQDTSDGIAKRVFIYQFQP